MDELKEVGGSCVGIGVLIVLCGKDSATWIGLGFIILGVIVLIVDRLLGIKEGQ
jgi:hypothetical protein